jgi:hypothetical protein
LCDPEELKQADGDPIALQRLVDNANDAEKPLPPGSYDLLIQSLMMNLRFTRRVLILSMVKSSSNLPTERSYWLFHFIFPRELSTQRQRKVRRSMIFSKNLLETIGINSKVSNLMTKKRLPNSTMKNTLANTLSSPSTPRVKNSK